MRSSLLDVLGEDFILTARAKGVREQMVLNRHAVRNALLPTITLIALSFGFVLGGAITVEFVFSYKGLGRPHLRRAPEPGLPAAAGASSCSRAPRSS